MNKTINVFYRNLWIIVIFLFFTACNKQQKPKLVFNINTPGGIVMETYNDSLPKTVYYYKLDEKGVLTHEKIGEVHYYANKQEYTSGGYKDGKKEGKWYSLFRDGSLQSEINYSDGIEHGAYYINRENGNPLIKGHYNHGNCDGTWCWYDENGKETKKIKADENTIACDYCPKCLKLKQK